MEDINKATNSTLLVDSPDETRWPNEAFQRWQENVIRAIGTHPYVWTGRSANTCAVTGGDQWCGLPEEHPIHH